MKIKAPKRLTPTAPKFKSRFLLDQTKPFDKFRVEQIDTMGDFANATRDQLPGETRDEYNAYLRPFLRAIIARQNQVSRETKPLLDNGVWLAGKPHYFQTKEEMKEADEMRARRELEAKQPVQLKAKFLKPAAPGESQLDKIRVKVRSALNDAAPKKETAAPLVHPSQLTEAPGNKRKPRPEDYQIKTIDNQARIARQKRIFPAVDSQAEAVEIVTKLEPAIKQAAKKAWDRHPNNPKNKKADPAPAGESLLARLARIRAQNK